jgi:hypothetical protein
MYQQYVTNYWYIRSQCYQYKYLFETLCSVPRRVVSTGTAAMVSLFDSKVNRRKEGPGIHLFHTRYSSHSPLPLVALIPLL